MKIQKTTVEKITLTELDGLDPVAVIAEDIKPRHGKITITCYGKSWTAYWDGIGDKNIAQFFCSCNNSYLMGRLSPETDSSIPDIDGFKTLAESKDVFFYRDDPWNDWDLMCELFGNDPVDWGDRMPKTVNPEYQYVCRIIDAVKEGLQCR